MRPHGQSDRNAGSSAGFYQDFGLDEHLARFGLCLTDVAGGVDGNILSARTRSSLSRFLLQQGLQGDACLEACELCPEAEMRAVGEG